MSVTETSPSSTPTSSSTADNPLAVADPDIWHLVQTEAERQENTLEMIASENHASAAVMAANGSCLTNKYAEGYPGKRYYSGCDYYDKIEQIAIDRAKELFGCEYANVQPHSGANANLAAFAALLEPGDTFMSIVLSDGGHLTHGATVNYSGKWFKPVHYPLVYDRDSPEFGRIDYDAIDKLVLEHKPKLLICGYSAYPRVIDFERFRKAADSCGALLMADIAHIAGLVAGGAHRSPFPHCDIVTTTTHKTLRGPRGGLIMTNSEDISKKVNRAVFPGTQGGPLMHTIAAKAVCFGEALKPEFKDYAASVVKNTKAFAEALIAKGWELTSNGSDNHLVVADFTRTHPELTGKDGALWLEQAGIISSKSTVPNDSRSPFVTSGVRLGTPALTSRGMGEAEMQIVATLVDRAWTSGGDDATCDAIRSDVVDLCKQFPMPH